MCSRPRTWERRQEWCHFYPDQQSGTIVGDKLIFVQHVDVLLDFQHWQHSCSLVCWFGSLPLMKKNQLMATVKVCGRTVGVTITDLSSLYSDRGSEKVQYVLAEPSQPVLNHLMLLPSGRKSSLLKGNRNNCESSLVPAAIGVFLLYQINQLLFLCGLCVFLYIHITAYLSVTAYPRQTKR